MSTREDDVLIVGAGFSGLYALYRLRRQGLSVRVLEAAPDVGGTWFWNAYPGARCDVESLDYSYSFSPELDQEWVWTERYATQPEILGYIRHVAERFDLRRDIRFSTRVESARYDESAAVWCVTTDSGEQHSARFLVLATGTLSAPIAPPFAGAESFAGESYMTQGWPHEPVDFAGKRVAVIGTGSSGIQSVPVIAETARHLTVFQRTANYSVPSRNRPLTDAELAERKAVYADYRRQAEGTAGGVVLDVNPRTGAEMSPAEQRAELERRWAHGGALTFMFSFADVMFDEETNRVLQDFVREKIRATVDDPEVAELLCPKDHPIGGKRPCCDTGYFQAFNRANVDLVDVRTNPISEVTPSGLRLADGTEHELDVIVYALGYDAITGALLRMDIRGRGGQPLAAAWENGPSTYLGLTVAGFPNMFTLTGPGSPGVFAMLISLGEQHVSWVADCIAYLDKHGIATIEASRKAQEEWTSLVAMIASPSLHTKTPGSYYMGGNVPGKPAVFSLYLGGLDRYRALCRQVADADYRGFLLDGDASPEPQLAAEADPAWPDGRLTSA